MNKFDLDLYDFITMSENFQPAFEIATKYESFRKKLIKDFWDKVISKLEEKSSKLNGWIPWVYDEVIKGYDRIAGLHHKTYTCDEYDDSVGTCFFNHGGGQICYGVYFNKDVPTLNYEKVMNYASRIIKDGWKLAPKSWWFPIYKYTDENFTSYSSLKKILPSEGDFLAEDYANKLIATHIEFIVFIEKFGTKY